jgi:hypothetical protein
VVLEQAAYEGGLSCFEEGPMYDDQAVKQYLNVDHMRANVAVSQAAYAVTRDRTTRDHSWSTSGITALLITHGHSPEKAAEILRVAQISWSERTF